jgi:hypothetical protein
MLIEALDWIEQKTPQGDHHNANRDQCAGGESADQAEAQGDSKLSSHAMSDPESGGSRENQTESDDREDLPGN